jgi:L-lactate dehydrogenase complex protein LldF
MLATLKDPDALRDVAARIRVSNLARLDEHLDRMATGWEAHGGKVFFAADAGEACTYVLDVARRAGADLVVKSKSMASEEIGLNHVLAEAGIEAVETDLGEHIIQLAGEHPSHIVAPAVHKSKGDVRDLFSDLAGRMLPEDAEALMQFARQRLRERFLSARLGITGVNFAVSEAGAICLVTNEGNGRMCSSMPSVHIAIMGMERIVGTWDELAVMLSLLAKSATGQKLTQYTSLLFGPRRPGELDGPEESHLVVLDNGRAGVLGTEYEAVLHCIRCGACLNVCPVYRQVGGHAYDPVYSGPIGAVLNPIIKGTREAGELAHASTLCGACTEACPVRIPLHDILLYLRRDYAREAAPVTERAAYGAWSRAWASARRFRAFGAAQRLLGRALRGRALRRAPVPLLSRWARVRAAPDLSQPLYRDGGD